LHDQAPLKYIPQEAEAMSICFCSTTVRWKLGRERTENPDHDPDFPEKVKQIAPHININI
jgi:hypothetical protein